MSFCVVGKYRYDGNIQKLHEYADTKHILLEIKNYDGYFRIAKSVYKSKQGLMIPIPTTKLRFRKGDIVLFWWNPNKRSFHYSHKITKAVTNIIDDGFGKYRATMESVLKIKFDEEEKKEIKKDFKYFERVKRNGDRTWN